MVVGDSAFGVWDSEFWSLASVAFRASGFSCFFALGFDFWGLGFRKNHHPCQLPQRRARSIL